VPSCLLRNAHSPMVTELKLGPCADVQLPLLFSGPFVLGRLSWPQAPQLSFLFLNCDRLFVACSIRHPTSTPTTTPHLDQYSFCGKSHASFHHLSLPGNTLLVVFTRLDDAPCLRDHIRSPPTTEGWKILTVSIHSGLYRVDPSIRRPS
jgi:hypothetical protein